MTLAGTLLLGVVIGLGLMLVAGATLYLLLTTPLTPAKALGLLRNGLLPEAVWFASTPASYGEILGFLREASQAAPQARYTRIGLPQGTLLVLSSAPPLPIIRHPHE